MNGEERDGYLDRVLIGGRERREIVVVDYDPGWPQRFEHERARIETQPRAPCSSGLARSGSLAAEGLSQWTVRRERK